MIYTVWKTLLVLVLSTGSAEVKAEFPSQEACVQVQEALTAQGIEAGDCYGVTVWGAVGPDGYNAVTGQYE